MVCIEPPEGFDRWTWDLLQEHSVRSGIVPDIGRDAIRIILQEHDLKSWQQKSWCVPDLDEEFIERMEDLLQVYEREQCDDFPVICLDEKPI